MNKTAADLLDGELFDLPIEKKIRIWELIDQHVKSEHFEEFTIVSTLIIKGYFEDKEKMGKYMKFYIQRYPLGYFTGLFKDMLADKPSDVCLDSTFNNLFGMVSYFITETGATLSANDYSCLSDDQKQKCKPIYK